MKKHLYLIGSIILVAAALFLRLNHLSARAPFDWDQNRDYQVIEGISRGKATLIGPVAKGEGGFFLGPLYYYLATPAFLLSRGDPLSLPLTSVTLDVFAIIAILALLPRVWSRKASFVLASIWSFSFFAIELSKISWNVALLPLFSVILLYLSSLPTRSRYINILFGLFLGLSWHIHASLIPLIPLLIVALLLLRRLKLSELPLLILGYIISLSPLIIFDLRHNFLNLHLMLNFAKASGGSIPDLSALFSSVFSRFGKNIYSFIFAKSDLHLWWGISFALLSFLALFKGSMPAKISGAIILLNLIFVLALREIGFAEYYLGISYLPSLLILLDFFTHFPSISHCCLVFLLALVLFANYRAFTIFPTSHSLGQKQDIVEAIATRSNSVDLHYDLPFGRDTGFNLLLPRSGVKLDPDSKTKVIISEKMSERLYIDGELTKDLGFFGGMHVGILVVQ